MSGIFVNQKDRFDITLFFENKNNKINILDEKKEGCESITLIFQYPDFSTTQRIMQDSIVDGTQGKTLDAFRLRSNLLYFLTVGWDAKDSDGNSIPFSQEELNKIHPTIASTFINKLQDKIGESGSLAI